MTIPGKPSERNRSRTMLMGKYPKREVLTGALFLLPVFIIFFVFRYYPLIDNIFISFTSWNMFTPRRPVGFRNFQTILSSAEFWKILGNTLFYTFWTTILSLVLGLILAVLLFRKTSPGGRILKTLFFIPNITTASAVALLWVWIFDPDFGLLGQIFNFFGTESPRWLLDRHWAMWIIVSLTVWRSMGYAMLLFSTGLTGIAESFYEAARIDGASEIQQFFFITLPLLAPTTYFLLTTSFISAMQVFDVVQVMTMGGPNNNTNVLNLYIYQQAFIRNRAGMAAALSVILFVLLVLLTIVQRRFDSGKEELNFR
jgi:ABC-type sugar transport system permease subunit